MVLVIEIKNKDASDKYNAAPQYVADMKSVKSFIDRQFKYMSGRGTAPGLVGMFNARTGLRTTSNINYAERFSESNRLKAAQMAKQLEMVGIEAKIVTDTPLPLKALRWIAGAVRFG